jgi:hypothetical protein
VAGVEVCFPTLRAMELREEWGTRSVVAEMCGVSRGWVVDLLSRVPKGEAPGAPMFVLWLDVRKDILAVWLPSPVPKS